MITATLRALAMFGPLSGKDMNSLSNFAVDRILHSSDLCLVKNRNHFQRELSPGRNMLSGNNNRFAKGCRCCCFLLFVIYVCVFDVFWLTPHMTSKG